MYNKKKHVLKYSQKQTHSNHDVNRKNAQNLPSLTTEIFSIFLEISISRNFGKVKKAKMCTNPSFITIISKTLKDCQLHMEIEECFVQDYSKL